MTTPQQDFEALDSASGDELGRLELRIARRADELSRQCSFDWFDPLDNWHQAEREVWGETDGWAGQGSGATTR
jgi:hypothetical protein